MAGKDLNTLCYQGSLAVTVISYVYCGIGILIILQNAVAILALLRLSKFRTRAQMFVVSLMVADFIVGLLALITGICFNVTLTSDQLYYFNRIYSGGSIAPAPLAFLIMSLIATDRYVFIAHPLSYDGNTCRRGFITALVAMWIVAILYSISPQFLIPEEFFREACFAKYTGIGLATYVLWATWLLSTIIIFVSYFKITRIALKFNLRRKVSQTGTQNGHGLNKDKLVKVMRSVKMFSVVFAASVVCLLPLKVAVVISVFHPVPHIVLMILTALFMLHADCNFYIYIAMSKDFKGAVFKLGKDMCRCC